MPQLVTHSDAVPVQRQAQAHCSVIGTIPTATTNHLLELTVDSKRLGRSRRGGRVSSSSSSNSGSSTRNMPPQQTHHHHHHHFRHTSTPTSIQPITTMAIETNCNGCDWPHHQHNHASLSPSPRSVADLSMPPISSDKSKSSDLTLTLTSTSILNEGALYEAVSNLSNQVSRVNDCYRDRDRYSDCDCNLDFQCKGLLHHPEVMTMEHARFERDGDTVLHRACCIASSSSLSLSWSWSSSLSNAPKQRHSYHYQLIRRLYALHPQAAVTVNAHGKTPLHYACLYASEDVIRFLLTQAPQAARSDTALKHAIAARRSPSIIEHLLLAVDNPIPRSPSSLWSLSNEETQQQQPLQQQLINSSHSSHPVKRKRRFFWGSVWVMVEPTTELSTSSVTPIELFFHKWRAELERIMSNHSNSHSNSHSNNNSHRNRNKKQMRKLQQQQQQLRKHQFQWNENDAHVAKTIYDTFLLLLKNTAWINNNNNNNNNNNPAERDNSSPSSLQLWLRNGKGNGAGKLCPNVNNVPPLFREFFMKMTHHHYHHQGYTSITTDNTTTTTTIIPYTQLANRNINHPNINTTITKCTSAPPHEWLRGIVMIAREEESNLRPIGSGFVAASGIIVTTAVHFHGEYLLPHLSTVVVGIWTPDGILYDHVAEVCTPRSQSLSLSQAEPSNNNLDVCILRITGQRRSQSRSHRRHRNGPSQYHQHNYHMTALPIHSSAPITEQTSLSVVGYTPSWREKLSRGMVRHYPVMVTVRPSQTVPRHRQRPRLVYLEGQSQWDGWYAGSPCVDIHQGRARVVGLVYVPPLSDQSRSCLTMIPVDEWADLVEQVTHNDTHTAQKDTDTSCYEIV